MPPRGTSIFKDFIGTARDGLIDSPSLFSGVDLAGTDCALLRSRCFCSHEVAPRCAQLGRKNFLAWPNKRLKMKRARERAGEQASFFGFCQQAVCEFAVLVPSDVDGRFEYDACELQLSFGLPQRSFDQELQPEKPELRFRQRVEGRDVAAGDGGKKQMFWGPVTAVTFEFWRSRKVNRGPDVFGRDFTPSSTFPSCCY